MTQLRWNQRVSTRSREIDIQIVGNSRSGHVYHSPQHTSSPVYVSSSGASSTGDRCLVTGLAGEVDGSMHMFPPFPLLNKVIQKLRTSGGHHNHGFHIYYICVWTTHASFRSAETCCHNRVISRVASCTICTHLEALMQHYLAAGFSKEVSKLAAALRRPSTNRMTGWLRFNWATGKGFDPLGPTAAQIAAFLYELFDTHGLLPQTIKGYRSCLASVLSRTGRTAKVQDLRHDHVHGIAEA